MWSLILWWIVSLPQLYAEFINHLGDPNWRVGELHRRVHPFVDGPPPRYSADEDMEHGQGQMEGQEHAFEEKQVQTSSGNGEVVVVDEGEGREQEQEEEEEESLDEELGGNEVEGDGVGEDAGEEDPVVVGLQHVLVRVGPVFLKMWTEQMQGFLFKKHVVFSVAICRLCLCSLFFCHLCIVS